MAENDVYCFQNGNSYIRVDPVSYHRELQNLLLAIQLAEEKIASLQKEMKALDEDADAYDARADTINDISFMIDDFRIRHAQLSNIPAHRGQ